MAIDDEYHTSCFSSRRVSDDRVSRLWLVYFISCRHFLPTHYSRRIQFLSARLRTQSGGCWTTTDLKWQQQHLNRFGRLPLRYRDDVHRVYEKEELGRRRRWRRLKCKGNRYAIPCQSVSTQDTKLLTESNNERRVVPASKQYCVCAEKNTQKR